MFLHVSVILFTEAGGRGGIPACIAGGIPTCLVAGLQQGVVSQHALQVSKPTPRVNWPFGEAPCIRYGVHEIATPLPPLWPVTTYLLFTIDSNYMQKVSTVTQKLLHFNRQVFILWCIYVLANYQRTPSQISNMVTIR